MSESLGHKASTGAIWASIDKFGSMGLQFSVNLILARILSPADFGIIGMLAIFIAVSQTLIDSGFASALIQKKNPTQTDFSTIFYWNITFSTLLYLILYAVAPFIAGFYSMPLLSEVLRIIALNLILTAALAIQRTRLQKDLAFKTICIVNLSSYICGALLAIFMAHHGWGVWSLVWMQLVYGILSIFLLAVITRWKPSLFFSMESLRELFGFGGFIMAANILQTICQNLQGLIIGKRFEATQMGYFSQAYKLDQISSHSIPQVIVQVMYPVYSSIQDDRERLNDMVLLSIRVVSFIIFPILSTLIIVSEPLIQFLYGDKWIPCVPYFRILCVGGFFVCLQNINFYAVAAVGKSKSLFKWSFYKWGFLLAALLIGMNFGMDGILWGMVLSSINIFSVNANLASKHTGLSVLRQFKSILPTLSISLLGLLISYLLVYVHLPVFLSATACLFIFISINIAGQLRAWLDFKIVLNKLINR
ncbi:MAG: lipopolysaccharide biosynthesis protein [Allobaculum sp.]|nr:lipopolysaccharide biosynthesis protein [Allobaculum sp.]